MAEDSGQKTEKPTPRRLREARKKGQIPRSADLVGWVTLLAASFVVPGVVAAIHLELANYFGRIRAAAEAGEVEALIGDSGGLIESLALILAPLLLLVTVVAAAGMAVQGGVTLTAETLRPKLERISLKAGVKRLFSAQSVVDTAKAIVRLAVLAALVAAIASDFVTSYLGGARLDLAAAGQQFAASLLLLIRLAAAIGVVIGLGDYAFQRHKTAKKLRMSKHETRQESRTTEGDPMIRSRRRALHTKLSQNQMLAAVGDASVVVVNPIHVAVALAYAPGTVPKVVAKGEGEVAMRIRDRAFQKGVPVVETRPLARILHDAIDVGAEVPADMYEAVAIVIAFVMRTPHSALEGVVRTVNVPRSKLGGRDASSGSKRRRGDR